MLSLSIWLAIAGAVETCAEAHRRDQPPPRDDAMPLRWVEFSPAVLESLKSQGKTVVVCVTAYWGCGGVPHFHENTLNRAATWLLMDELGAVPLLADYTETPRKLQDWLLKFNTFSIPLTVIYPGQRPEQPIVLHDLYDQAMILETLRDAGPSVGVEK